MAGTPSRRRSRRGRSRSRPGRAGRRADSAPARARARGERCRPVRVPLPRPRAYLRNMPDLFDEAAGRRLEERAPLAQRLRPRRLDDFVGQEHVVGPGRALRLASEQDRVPSMILYGPPGSGKTTLARIVAQTTGAEFAELSAVQATVAKAREVPK